ncbi:pyridoxamine 5'-phosphate oxidase family protein [bacterium]|nr:pyridoxamine 5'-phosphate oxidase family protein [bacterium]
MADLKQEFWDRLSDVRACMLGFSGNSALVAMSPQLDDDLPGHVWFITAKGTNLAKGVAAGDAEGRLVVSDAGAGLYADVSGNLSHSTDREALDEVWSFVADAWFEGGQHDPDVCLLCFTPAQGSISITTNGAKFLYEIAKANLTGAKPDAGEHGEVTF